MSELGTKKSGGLSRRDFLKLMGAAGTGLAFAPFVPFGNFMPNPNQASLEKVPVILPDGTHANVNTYPINQTGTYTLLTHSTLFGGSSTTEPITLAAKFTNISTEIISQNKEIVTESEQIISESKENNIIIHETTPEETLITNSKSDSSFNLGIIIGVSIGAAISIVIIFIMRQKPIK